MTYEPIEKPASDDHLRWDIPSRHQNQMIEVAYADAVPGASPADVGSLYKRITDRSDGSVTYYRRDAQ